MIGDITQVALGGIVALLILREVFKYLADRKRPPTVCALATQDPSKRRRTTDRFKEVQSGVEAVLSRLDTIIERLDDVKTAVRASRKQSEITGEMAERMTRSVAHLEQTINDALGRRRTTDTSPGV